MASAAAGHARQTRTVLSSAADRREAGECWRQYFCHLQDCFFNHTTPVYTHIFADDITTRRFAGDESFSAVEGHSLAGSGAGLGVDVEGPGKQQPAMSEASKL